MIGTVLLTGTRKGPFRLGWPISSTKKYETTAISLGCVVVGDGGDVVVVGAAVVVVVVLGTAVTLVAGSAVVVVVPTLAPLGLVETGTGSDVVVLSGASPVTAPAAHADNSMARPMLRIPKRLMEVLSSVVR
ncbi:MAG TPA: hypothetical protein VMS99_04965 [Acidimicrobiia bacterium]|nr:hypothetical protein [Acidimicrobiia bacterium]